MYDFAGHVEGLLEYRRLLFAGHSSDQPSQGLRTIIGIVELTGNGESLLVALAYLGRIDPLLETIVAGDEQFLDPLVRVSGLHERSLAAHISV